MNEVKTISISNSGFDYKDRLTDEILLRTLALWGTEVRSAGLLSDFASRQRRNSRWHLNLLRLYCAHYI
jgi:hypothetical protein